MNYTIEAPFTISDQDKAMIEEKVNALTTYESRITQVNIHFKEDDGHVEGGILSRIVARVPGEDVLSSKVKMNAMSAFNESYKSLKRQIKDRREQLNDHRSEIKEINEIVNNTY